MHRTPPRRSPRFQNQEMNAESNANMPNNENESAVSTQSEQSQPNQNENPSQGTSSQLIDVSNIDKSFEPSASTKYVAGVLKALQEKIIDLEGKLLRYESMGSSNLLVPSTTQPAYDDANTSRAAHGNREATTALEVNSAPIAALRADTLAEAHATSEANIPAIPKSSTCSSIAANAATITVSASNAATCNANFGGQSVVPIAFSVAQPLFPQSANVHQPPFRIAEVQSTYTNTSVPASIPQPFSANMRAFSPISSSMNVPSGYLAPRKLQDIPDFSGQPEDWPMFVTAFQQSTQAYGYTNWENTQRLQKCLKGAARELVKCLLIHPDNVDAIIEHLRSRFGRPEQLIHSQLTAVREVTQISENAITKLVPFSTKVKNFTAFLQSVNGHQHLSNPILLEELVSKLPMSKRIEWARFSSSLQPYPSIAHFSSWLSQIADLVFAVQGHDNHDAKRRVVLHTSEDQSSQPEVQQQTKSDAQETAPKKCPMCSSQHKPSKCQRLIDASVDERWKAAKRHRLCFSCLNLGHSTRDCRQRKPCLIDGCKRKHHKMLHDGEQAQSDESTSTQLNHQQSNHASSSHQTNQTADSASGSILSCASKSTDRKLLYRILPVTLYGKDKHVDTYALMDEGSSVTLIDNSIVDELGLRGQQRNLNVRWYGGREAQETAIIVNLQASGAGMRKRHQLNNVYSVPNLDLPSQSLSEAELRSASCRAQQLPLQPYDGAVPKILIGLDHCHLGLPSEVMKISRNGPFAANTELGWCVFGPTAESTSRSAHHLFFVTASDSSLHDMVASFFETENFGVKALPPLESKADIRAKAILQSTTRRIDGRFETGLLSNREFIKMPNSYEMARKRLTSIEKKMQRNEEFAKAYKNIIDSYIHKGYARKLSPEEANVVEDKTWYLPHFGVVNPNKPAKLRLVFDAAAEVNGKSLNSYLLKGPQDYRPLPAILYHFREGAVAMENVADEATRANVNANNCIGSRWFCGPRFLRADEEGWPGESLTVTDDEKDDEELRQVHVLTVANDALISFHRFSSFSRLVRSVAWVMRFVNKIRRRNDTGNQYGLTSSELEASKVILYRRAQMTFESEHKQIRLGLPVSRTSILYKLLPYVDEKGVLRAKGRIDAASWLPLSTRRPIILPADHALTGLIVTHHHNQMKHQNEEATIWEIRRQYWIPRMRQVLRSIAAKCPTCRINKATPATPIMGPLPADRLTPYVRPFSYTGLDYFGPTNVTIGRRLEKRWVALFTCLSVRAIHLELAHDLSTDACIIAIRNFINRRGVPTRMRSDNGKNFVGADQEAKRFDEVFDCVRIQDELASKGIDWLFNCPINPSEGGVWERLVQSVKRVLRHTLKEVSPREHTFNCLLIEAENVVNSRPLTHLPIDVDQEEPLTPNHFLLGTANTAQTPSIDQKPDSILALRKQWRIARQFRDHFWRRWITEYLPTLTRRSKWCQHLEPLKEGDLVFICDPAVPRRQWCRGIIENVFPGKDGVIRQADVRTAHGSVLRRATSKLAILNVKSGEADRFTRGGVSTITS